MSFVEKISAAVPSSIVGPDDRNLYSDKFLQLTHYNVYLESIVAGQKTIFCLGKKDQFKHLLILTLGDIPAGFHGSVHNVVIEGKSGKLAICPLNGANAAELRREFAYLVPVTFGLEKTAGCGDRLGLATPGHIRAIRKVFGDRKEKRMMPILAQQSMRENSRTGRNPQVVVDDATWGVFQAGWTSGYGADADHLKTTEDIDLCAAAGYTFFTVDPGDHVDESAETADSRELKDKAGQIPWGALETSLSDSMTRMTAQPIPLETGALRISQEELLRAVVKYGRVIAYTVHMYRHLVSKMGGRPFDFEMSVDETRNVTSLPEHVYIASELKRLGVNCTSLAPRYVGRFEKGVDYMGDEEDEAGPAAMEKFEKSFAQHVAVARLYGPYKLSLHSGSDKFTVYPVCSRLAGELVHLKTAGTSYLEAVRTIASHDAVLFRDIYSFALQRYWVDRMSYHVSGDPAKAPDVTCIPDDQLPVVLNDFHARQILHVTFGSVLNEKRFRARFFETLQTWEETYYSMLEAHFERHLAPFGNGGALFGGD